MLYIAISRWKPGERNELLRRRLEQGITLPEGMTMLSDWTDLYGGREIMFLESNDSNTLIAGPVALSDPVNLEAQPV
jgi:hypothetical protein